MKPSNQQPYFPHDANTRNKDRIIRLRMDHGPAGYGIYFMLLERLRNDDHFECELDYSVIAFDLDCDQEIIRSVINDYGLFEIIDDGQKFYSIELSEKMEFMQQSKQKRIEAARKAAECRWGKSVDKEVESSKLPESEETIVVENTSAEKNIVKAEENLKGIDYEVEEMNKDSEWCKELEEEFNISTSEIETRMEDFRKNCRRNGIKVHKNIVDAKRHFRSYLRKVLVQPEVNGRNSRNKNTLTNQLKRQEEERLRRNDELDKRDKLSQSSENYFRNQGYEPGTCTFLQVGDPEWKKNNQPPHPEWIGMFPGRETMEEVLSKLEIEKSNKS